MQEGAAHPPAGRSSSHEAVCADEPEPGPLRQGEREIAVDRAGGGKEEEESWKARAESNRSRIESRHSHLVPPEGVPGARLDAHELGVEVGESDGHRGPDDDGDGLTGLRGMQLEGDHQSQAYDRAIDDARDVA